MTVAGYVLVGGNSTRMGQDKALLPFGESTLAQHVAGAVESATGNVTLIGDPAKYAFLGLSVIPDGRRGCGPLAGMESALRHSGSEWNLMAACDMAGANPGLLAELCQRATLLAPEADCLVPMTPAGGLQPLCAVYRRRCLPAISAALDASQRKVRAVISALNLQTWDVPDDSMFQNINTPKDWMLMTGFSR